MDSIKKEKILEIIKRHVGEQIFVISCKTEGIVLQTGFLTGMTNNGITLSAGRDKASNDIPFLNGSQHHILNIYNRNNIDLLKAASTEPLAEKLKDREKKKKIFANIRPHLKKDLFFIYKQQAALNLTTGMFVDMGIMGITLKLSPFYNKELSLPYNSVLHIYSQDHKDLLS